ncbi:MAG: filamentous hemagglutinin N-terminal domain-containing protein, partial [Pseudomonadota bacterium]
MRNILLSGLVIVSTCAHANPENPTVVHGTATFSQPNANTLNVTNSHNAIINWQSFNIGQGQTTNFIQPSANSAVLNQVMSNAPSSIYGNLNSNGKVFLINQHGLMIGAGAKINTAGFYGSTLNITNEDFLKGDLKFEGGGLGGIHNLGYIHAGPNGNVVLIAPDIENGGVIEVENGQVILAAGESIRLTSLNDSSIEFDVESTAGNEVINLGSIIASNGAVRLFADSLTHSGDINANKLVRNADGSISLVAETVEVTGTMIAGGVEGGDITVEADVINIHGDAVIDASGSGAGGTILIGGDRQGLNPDVRNATSTTLGANASIHADATDHGDGGKVILFAQNDVHVHGEVTARGGPHGGDGGFIETSGLEVLDITRVPDAAAPHGLAGEWLIDP